MIITVTLNAAIDKTLAVPNFRLGRRHRATEQTAMAGGKGVNVARALKALGQPVIATGVAGGPTGTRIIEQLTDEAILNDFVRIHEESRTSTAVVDPTSGEQTEINERGPSVTEVELELFVDKLLYLAKGAGVCVICGSLPGGVDNGLYARLVEGMRRLGVTTVLDCEGEPLRQATRAQPDVVTPNEVEAEELVGHEFADDEDRRTAIDEIIGARCPRRGHDAARRLPGAAGRPTPTPPTRAGWSGPRSIRWSRSRRSGREMPSSPDSSPPATTGARRRTACASRSPAARSPPSTSGPGCWTPGRSSASRPRSISSSSALEARK